MPVEPAFDEPRSLFSDLREWLPSYTEHGTRESPILIEDDENPFVTARNLPRPNASDSGSINQTGKVFINKGR